MRRLLSRLLLLAAPFGLYSATVFVIDPFDYFRAGDEALKAQIAGKLDPPLFKLLAFRRLPRTHILLGDSRMNSLGEARVSAMVGAPVANLAYGGGSLNEAIGTFWLVVGQADLESVTIGVNLDTYNESNAKDRVSAAESIMRNPALYLSNRMVALGVWYEIRRALTRTSADIGRPPMSPEDFWRYQLDVTAKRAYTGYLAPASYRNQLAEVAAECARRGIRLQFVVFPEHTDLVAVASQMGLEPAAERMRIELAAIGTTIDFSSRSDWIGRRDYFVDPFHFAPAVVDEIVDRVWGVHD